MLTYTRYVNDNHTGRSALSINVKWILLCYIVDERSNFICAYVDMVATVKLFVVVCQHFKMCGVVLVTSGFYLKIPPVKLSIITYDKSLHRNQS